MSLKGSEMTIINPSIAGPGVWILRDPAQLFEGEISNVGAGGVRT